MNRFTRLFRADMNAILDNLEEPEIILKQALREMETSLLLDETQLKKIQGQLKITETTIISAQDCVEKYQIEIQLCLDAKNDSLAKSLIRKKLHQQNIIQSSKKSVSALLSHQSNLASSIKEKQQTLNELKQKIKLITVKPNLDNVHSLGSDFNSVSEEDVEIELLRLQSKNPADSKKRKVS